MTLANFVTTASLVAGLVALFEITRTGVGIRETRLVIAFALIVLAAILDAIDGPMARWRQRTSAFGGELDSLADIVSFGVVPPAMVCFSELYRVHVAGALVCVLFCTCGAWRLARFQQCGQSEWFIGLPVPLAAVIVGLVVTLQPSAAGALIVVALLSCLMVGTLPFPTWAALRPHVHRRGDLETPQPPARAVAMVARYKAEP